MQVEPLQTKNVLVAVLSCPGVARTVFLGCSCTKGCQWVCAMGLPNCTNPNFFLFHAEDLRQPYLYLVKMALGLPGGFHSCGECGIIAQHQQPLFAFAVVPQNRLSLQLHKHSSSSQQAMQDAFMSNTSKTLYSDSPSRERQVPIMQQLLKST